MKYIKRIILLSLVLFSIKASAATVFISAPKSLGINQEAMISVMINTEKATVNAVSTTLNIPSELEVSKIYDGNSILVAFVEQPKVNTENNTIHFSGITPGGFNGVYQLISFVIKAKKAGNYSITAKEIQVLKNDGSGTAIKSIFEDFPITISKTQSSETITFVDKIVPENFTPTISNNVDIYDGAYFLSFVTQDKGVGIDHYEYQSTWVLSPNNTDWVPAISPLKLSKLDIYKNIYIKAIDREGNERVAIILGPYRNKMVTGFAIAILVLLFVLRRFKL